MSNIRDSQRRSTEYTISANDVHYIPITHAQYKTLKSSADSPNQLRRRRGNQTIIMIGKGVGQHL